MGPWDVNPNWMGVFMDKDSLVLSLWEAGVPVWHIHKIKSLLKDLCVGKRVSMKWDPDIETHHDPASPHTAIHTRFRGEARAYLCRPIGNLALGNYVPLLLSESWDTWVKCAAPPNSNSLMATETFSPHSRHQLSRLLQAHPLWHTLILFHPLCLWLFNSPLHPLSLVRDVNRTLRPSSLNWWRRSLHMLLVRLARRWPIRSPLGMLRAKNDAPSVSCSHIVESIQLISSRKIPPAPLPPARRSNIHLGMTLSQLFSHPSWTPGQQLLPL
jgi:hypothetical protein